MSDEQHDLIRAVYKKWKSRQVIEGQGHPDEETFAAFLENRLPAQESEQVKNHLVSCDQCAQILALSIKPDILEEKHLPEHLLERARSLLDKEFESYLLEIILKLKEKALEIINTTGDILLGQELVPAAVLRSRQVRDFKDEVTILKDFKDIRVEAKIENKQGKAFALTIVVKDKQTQNIIKDLRVTLLKDDLELESYHTDTGKVSFEHVLLGKYTLEITSVSDKLAAILLDIKV
jgi:hypothetical protein